MHTLSAWAKEPVTDWASTAFSTEEYTLDACGGHSTTEGWYHYHGTPGCLEEQIMMGENISMSEHSPFLGWSYVSRLWLVICDSRGTVFSFVRKDSKLESKKFPFPLLPIDTRQTAYYEENVTP